MILNEGEAKKLLTKALAFSTADSISATLGGWNSYNIRFALNSATTDGYSDGLRLSVTSYIGRKSGTSATNKFTDESIKETIARSEQVARLSPENKEFMPPPGPQSYLSSNNYSENTENLSTGNRANMISYVEESSVKNNVNSAGFLEDFVNFTAVMNSKGLFAYNKETLASLSSTFRTKEGNGSSRFEKDYADSGELDSVPLTDKAISRTKLSVNPEEISPGRYTVILEASAVADMVTLGVDFMNARQADEGRSFFSKKGGGNLIGELLANERVNIYSDPTDLNAPAIPFAGDGMPRNKTVWLENGYLRNLMRNRYWAEKTGMATVPYPSNVLMSGSEKTLEQMIAETDSAILVTRFWYIRTVDPRTMLLTGLTRDGVFEIRDGKIFRPVKNFRFNESPMNVLANVLDIGKSEKAQGAETGGIQIHVPPLKISNFNFSSLSDAI